MACCVFTAFVMNRIIKACEVLDLNLISIQYNVFDNDHTLAGKAHLSSSTVVKRFTVEGMTCAACVTSVQSAIGVIAGVDTVSISLPLSRATVVYDESVASSSKICAAISSKGYNVQEGHRSAGENIEIAEQKARLSSLRASFGQAFSLAMLLISAENICRMTDVSRHHIWLKPAIYLSLGAWIQIYTAWVIHCSAWRKGMFHIPNMDTLISLSLFTGLCLSFLDLYLEGTNASLQHNSSGSFLVVVIVGGRYVQTLLQRQTSTSLTDLYRMQHATSLVRVRRRTGTSSFAVDCQPKCADNMKQITAISLRPGDEIIVEPGTIIPCDCYITSGTSIINQSAMTGESLPVNRTVGDFLMSGTRNLASTLTVVVSRTQEESALEQLISCISLATEDRAVDIETDMITSSFAGMILLLGLCTGLLAFIGTNDTWPMLMRLDVAGSRAMAVLASACPCALGLASPTAVLSGISVAWTKGIIFASGFPTIRRLANISHIVMDKTGTLTTGELSVTRVIGDLKPLHHILLCAAERDDALVHPVARSVFQYSLVQLSDEERTSQSKACISSMRNEPGKGLSCCVSLTGSSETYNVHVGTPRFLEENNVEIPSTYQKGQGSEIAVHVAINHKHRAILLIRDTVRPEASSIIQMLKTDIGLSVSMLTGDAPEEANRVSEALNVAVLASRALPLEKRAFVEDLQKLELSQGVAMIGDGINDAAAMKTADVGILLSPGLSTASPSCVQVADIILTTPHLGGLAEAVLIARATLKQVHLNRRWAIGYNAIAVTLATGMFECYGIKIDASMAGTLMAFSSISVMSMSLWLRTRLFSIDVRHW